MNVMNTIPGEAITEITAVGVVVIALLFIAAFLMALAFLTEEPTPGFFGLMAFMLMIFLMLVGDLDRDTGRVGPTRYEVTLEPGAVIDAAKYEVIEQRGEIYVIEEREAAE